MVFANLYTFLAYLALCLCRRFQFKVKDNMAKTGIQYIKGAAKKLIDSKLQRLGAAKTQEIFKGVNADSRTRINGRSIFVRSPV